MNHTSQALQLQGDYNISTLIWRLLVIATVCSNHGSGYWLFASLLADHRLMSDKQV